MAQIKVNKITGNFVNINVLWDDGLFKNGLDVPDVPVDSFESAKNYLFAFVTGIYQQVKAEADAAKGPTIDPQVLAAVGHTFDNEGNILS